MESACKWVDYHSESVLLDPDDMVIARVRKIPADYGRAVVFSATFPEHYNYAEFITLNAAKTWVGKHHKWGQ